MMKIAVATIVAMVACSCGSSSSNDKVYNKDGTDYELETIDNGNNQNSNDEQMYVCPMCGGTGVFEVMPGDVMAPRQVCQGCGGKKVVTAEQAQSIMEAKGQVDAMMGGGNSIGGSGRNAYEIELDLKKAYELLESMECDYQHCTSGVLKAQYPSMIADQRSRIRQLENELRKAQ